MANTHVTLILFTTCHLALEFFVVSNQHVSSLFSLSLSPHHVAFVRSYGTAGQLKYVVNHNNETTPSLQSAITLNPRGHFHNFIVYYRETHSPIFSQVPRCHPSLLFICSPALSSLHTPAEKEDCSIIFIT